MSAAAGIDRRIGQVSWAVILGALIVNLALQGASADPSRPVVLVSCGTFFALLLTRLALSARGQAANRGSVALLMAGLVLWGAESTQVQAASSSAATRHLAAGELAYVGAYLAFALYILVAPDYRPSHGVRTWLETLVVCGGSACLAGAVMLTPIAAGSGTGWSAFVALLYPVADVVLGLLVVAQIALRMRCRDSRSARLCAGFFVLAAADSTFVGGVQHGSQDASVLTIVLWAVGFGLVVSAASSKRVTAIGRPLADMPALILTGAAVAAIAVLLIRPDGPLGIWLSVPAVVTLVASGVRLVLALRDARGAAEAIVLSHTDDLTKLPNRRAILSRIDTDLQHGRPLALMIMDLDGFKDINDGLGHELGDVILAETGRRMREALPQDVMVARLGGDEFALAVPETDELTLLEVANKVVRAVREPTVADDIELVVGASLGIAVGESSDRESSGLLRRADIAMYQAKTGGGGARMYDRTRDDSRSRLQLAEELRRGLREGQVVLWYQPQLASHSRRITGLEGLVRWNHPTRGLLQPSAFLPVARQAGLMPAISDLIIQQAVSDVCFWSKTGAETHSVALNFAAPELLNGVFGRRIDRAITQAGLDPSAFVIEVTEDSFFADPLRAMEVLLELRSYGMQVSIDDYGTGFSSLSYLRDLPIDELKMDRSFVSSITGDVRGRMIVESTVRLAEALDLRMVAEGVEDAATLAAISNLGADVVQGYYLAKPMPARDVADWQATWTSDLAAVVGLSGR
jgi:diguanylate cyclase (GGDEF)-like protein